MTTREIDALLQAARPLFELAVTEDIGPGDATSNSTLNADAVLTGRIVAKEPGVVAGLPVAQREVFVLKHIEGLSYEEIAEITGRSVGALKVAGHRARRALVTLLRAAGVTLGRVNE